MGVTGLWTIVQPCARPVKLESLNQKRLAVDASIWIYQFLKAVRDKEGNALRNSHVVGFFRRICKLLFHGIKPVFVFDGGAPTLKRTTIAARKRRREGRREDAARTAGKLLAVQMQRRAEEEAAREREIKRGAVNLEDNLVAEGEKLVYVDELQMDDKERLKNRDFRKKDQYHLPDLDLSFAEMGGPDDPRIMSQAELEEYAKQFEEGEEVNLYDFAKIDFESPFFTSLPDTDRYNILNAARLRSRLRMGYSKDQLDDMFPDRMAFSRFQIDRVRERNELTQRLMNINGMNGKDMINGVNGGGRIAGEKGREYVLVKNEGAEGGWALGVVGGKKQGKRAQPIDVDGLKSSQPRPDLSDDEPIGPDDDFEDVPVEGLNRLPKRKFTAFREDGTMGGDMTINKRQMRYDSCQPEGLPGAAIQSTFPPADDQDSLFMPETALDHDEAAAASGSELVLEGEESELEKAIAMSLEQQTASQTPTAEPKIAPEAESRTNISSHWGINSKSRAMGKGVLVGWNQRSNAVFSSPSGPVRTFESLADSLQPLTGRSDDDTNPGHTSDGEVGPRDSRASNLMPKDSTRGLSQAQNILEGPLPFERLYFPKSSASQPQEIESLGRPESGAVPGDGFEIEDEQPKSLPPWFAGGSGVPFKTQRTEPEYEDQSDANSADEDRRPLMGLRQQSVIDVDAEDDDTDGSPFITIESDTDEDRPEAPTETLHPSIFSRAAQEDNSQTDAMADALRAEPLAESDDVEHSLFRVDQETWDPEPEQDEEAAKLSGAPKDSGSEMLDWSKSERDEPARKSTPRLPAADLADGPYRAPTASHHTVGPNLAPEIGHLSGEQAPGLAAEDSSDRQPFTDDITDFNLDSDDDMDLIQALEAEATEHARFASELNAKPQAQNHEDYEREFRTLRSQQRADRRDADEVNYIMVIECQQLLKLFGLPYITAPMEAEAQCAALVSLGLVDGIVTDDSDCFLFGGTRIYKNMFNQAKYVECYLTSDLEREYGLTRKSLIAVAQLLGSDYTEGIPTIGPVTAMEIITAFAPGSASSFSNNDIHDDSCDHDDDNDQIDKGNPLIPFRRYVDWTLTHPVLPKAHPYSALPKSNFLRKFRKQALKLTLPTGFPSLAVEEAYLKPEVDEDPTAFEWGVPDLGKLREFLMATVGWSPERTDEVLVPVIRDMNRRANEGTQANITRFFGGGIGMDTSANGVVPPSGRTTGAAGAGAGHLGSELTGNKRDKSKRMDRAMGSLRDRNRANRANAQG